MLYFPEAGNITAMLRNKTSERDRGIIWPEILMIYMYEYAFEEWV
jgi:hypothetical protein